MGWEVKRDELKDALKEVEDYQKDSGVCLHLGTMFQEHDVYGDVFRNEIRHYDDEGWVCAITYKTMKTLGGAKVIGPLLVGLGQAIEIAPLRSSTSDILNLASVAAYSAGIINYNKKN